MVKVDLAVLIASGKKLAESFMIGTKLQENGKPVRLEVVIDTQPGDGPFPLLVFNHGSTGQGNDPALFTQTFSNPAFVEMFVKKGYMIAFPQRRGRVPGGGWQGFVLRLPGAGRGRAQGDVFTAPLDRPR